MMTWLKKHFIPHKNNQHRPHFLHTKNTQRILVLVLALELLVFVLPALTFVSRVNNTNLASVLPGVLAVLTNDERKNNNLPELTVSQKLTEAAELKAKDMAENSYFAHTSPKGKTPWYWLEQVGYRYDYAGENLAINFSDSKDVTEAWMDSPTHRANIVKSSYTEVGTGIATGVYEGKETVFVAQLYANPKNSSATEARAASVEKAKKAEVKQEVKLEEKQETVAPTTTPEPEKAVTSELAVSSVSEESTEVLGAEDATPDAPSKFEKISASPRHAGNILFLIILGVTILALILNILIKVNVQHPDLITNGLLVTAVLIAILIANNFFGTKDIVISQGTDYSHEETIR